jgi:Protein kinase domain.
MEQDEIIFERFKVVKMLNPGGQGETAVVQDLLMDNSICVIKVLKEYVNQERISRMKHEIKILKKMSCNGIPRYKNDNFDDSTNERKYFTMEYIEGSDLRTTCQKATKNFDIIMCAFLRLLELVSLCHENGVVHRDIKPENIICRNNDLRDIVLIDFGIAYDEENEGENLTAIGQELGNRFLSLPELTIHKKDKHDKIADITLCIGILFFMLSGQPATRLVDEDGKKPHERVNAIINLQWIGSNRLHYINAIFDKGFNINKEERYKSIADLVFGINLLNKIPDELKSNYNTNKSFCLVTMESYFKNITVDQAYENFKIFNNNCISLGTVEINLINNIYYIKSKDLWITQNYMGKSINHSTLDGLFCIPSKSDINNISVTNSK